jgi:hypothetical protein
LWPTGEGEGGTKNKGLRGQIVEQEMSAEDGLHMGWLVRIVIVRKISGR